MRQKKYLLFDDLRKIGAFATLGEVYATGKIKQAKGYFFRRFSEMGCYLNDNISVYRMRDHEARCLFRAHTLNRWVERKSDTFTLNVALTKAVKEITGQDL